MDYSKKSKEELIEEINFLKKKEKDISSVLDNINEVIYHISVDENGIKKFVYISSHTERVLGITTEEYIDENAKKTITKLFHPDDLERLEKEAKKISPNEKDHSFTYRFYNKKLDKYIWIEENITTIFDEKGVKKALFGTAKNVTEKIEKENQLSFILENINECIYNVKFTSKEKKLSFISPHINKITGLTVEEFHKEGISGKLIDRIHPDDVEIMNKAQDDLYDNNKKQVKSTFRLKPKGSKSYLWIEETLHASYDKKGNLTETTTVLRDITQQKEFSEKLEFSEKSYKDLFYNSPDLIYVQNKEGKFIDVNKAVIEKYGYRKDEIIGKNTAFFNDEKSEKNNLPNILKKLEKAWKGEKQTFEFWGKKKDGSSFPKEVVVIKSNYFGEEVLMAFGRDITDKKEAIAHLKENEEKYRTIFTKNLAGVFITKDDKILDCNNSFAKIFGYKTRVELIGKNAQDLYIDIKDRENYIKDLKEKNFLTNYKIRHKNKEGKEIWILTNVYLKKDGKIEGTLVDISEQIKIEEKLKETTNNYKNLINNSPYGTIIHIDGNILFANPKALSLFGIKGLKDLKDKNNIFDYLPKKYHKEGLERRKKILNGEEVPFVEVSVKNPFTNKEMLLETKATKYDFNGKDAVQLFIKDITIEKELYKEKLRATIAEESNKILQKEIKVREEVEKKLKQNQKYLNSIINSSLDIICASDNDGNVIEFNEAAELAFGFSQKEIYNTPVNKIYASRDGYFVVSKALKEKGVYVGEILNKSKSGKIFTSFLSASVLYNEEGENIGTMGVSRDITELKEAENQLINSLKEKEVLLKEVHHRVKNNLQVISSILNLQSSYVKDSNTLNILKESQNRIKSMSFIHESLYQTNDFSSINFSEYIVSLSKNLVHSYGIYDDLIDLDFEIEDVQLNLDASIPCGLIVNELVSNALKYAFKENNKGKITITLFVKKGNVHLIIKDNGVGLSKEIDFRNTETLGLQLVTSLIEQLEGKIELKREKGTEYTIIFKHI